MGTPIPHRDNEMKGIGAGPVKPYQLSTEELEEIRKKYPSPSKVKKPASTLKNEEDQNMGVFNLAKEEYLRARLGGKSRKEIAKQQGITLNNLEAYWLKKWGIRDMDQEEIAMMELNRAPLKETQSDGVEQRPTTVSEMSAEASKGIVIKPGVSGVGITERSDSEEELRSEIARLKAELAKAAEHVNKNSEIAVQAQAELVKINDERNLFENENAKLKVQVDDFASGILERDREISRLKVALPENNPVSANVITIQFELHDYGADPATQHAKVIEELIELGDEIHKDSIDLARAWSEYLDVGQALTGLIRARLNELMIKDTNPAIKRYVEHHNRLHVEKLRGRLAANA